jgi:hypothetical protein
VAAAEESMATNGKVQDVAPPPLEVPVSYEESPLEVEDMWSFKEPPAVVDEHDSSLDLPKTGKKSKKRW